MNQSEIKKKRWTKMKRQWIIVWIDERDYQTTYSVNNIDDQDQSETLKEEKKRLLMTLLTMDNDDDDQQQPHNTSIAAIIITPFFFGHVANTHKQSFSCIHYSLLLLLFFCFETLNFLKAPDPSLFIIIIIIDICFFLHFLDFKYYEWQQFE